MEPLPREQDFLGFGIYGPNPRVFQAIIWDFKGSRGGSATTRIWEELPFIPLEKNWDKSLRKPAWEEGKKPNSC